MDMTNSSTSILINDFINIINKQNNIEDIESILKLYELSYKMNKLSSSTTVHNNNNNNDDDNIECMISAAHYFSVSQYVSSHVGIFEAGIRRLQEVHIMFPEQLLGNTGEGDIINTHTEAEAIGGDPEAQMFMGRRYYWGFGGVPPNIDIARRYHIYFHLFIYLLLKKKNEIIIHIYFNTTYKINCNNYV